MRPPNTDQPGHLPSLIRVFSIWRNLGSLSNHWAHSEDSDQTGRMPRLIWFFAGRTSIMLFVMRWLQWSCSNLRLNTVIYQFRTDQTGWVLIYPMRRTAKTLIRLSGCPGWSESSQGAHPLCWFVLSWLKWSCSNVRLNTVIYQFRTDQTGWVLIYPMKRTAKTLIRLSGCPGWSESSLGAHPWGGSNGAVPI